MTYDGARQRYDEIAATLPPDAWQQVSGGAGSKGERLYDWALVTWRRGNQAPDDMDAFLVRRNITDPTDEAYFRVFAPADTPLQTLVQVAGRRWTVEECFELAKGEVVLDQYEVRRWSGWYRHITLAMLALAFLVVVRHLANQQEAEKNEVATQPPTIALTVPEIRRVLHALLWLVRPAFQHVLAWSRWRRLHQFRAKLAHYRRQQRFLARMAALG